MTTSRRALAGAAALALAGGLLATVPSAASAAVPTTAPPVAPNPASVVRATALPTAQINGVGLAQVIVGDTVYVGGTFTTARPPGVAAGGAGEVTRGNIMAYSLSTGALLPFAPMIDNTVQALAASPDGTRLYVGGLFTSVNGTPRYRIAAFDTSDGSLISTFKPIPNYMVAAITATDTTVYFGGKFNNVGGVARSNLAAVEKDTGTLTNWAPTADSRVQAMILSPNGKKVFIAGNFASLDGTTARGLGSVTSGTGAIQAMPANQIVYSYGTKAAFLSLAVDSKNVYASSFNFGGSGNIEGVAAVNVVTGNLTWVEDCHGDTYGVWSDGVTVYTVGHAHYCGNIGGFGQVSSPGLAKRAIAFTSTAKGTVQTNRQTGYANLAGNPAPSLRAWFPNLKGGDGGDGSDQAAWAVTGSGDYVVMAGEITAVNNEPQSGIARFARVPISPDTQGPRLSGDDWVPKVQSTGPGAAQVSIGSNWDRDDLTLKYTITMDTGAGTASRNVYNKSSQALEWNLPTLTASVANLQPGATYRFRVFATDPAGNQAASPFVSYTVPGS